MGWRFDWLTGWDTVFSQGNLALWRGAFDPAAGARTNPFMHPDIVRAWLDAVGYESVSPFFFHGTSDDGSRALLCLVHPAQRWDQRLYRRLVGIGFDLFDYHDPVIVPGGAGAPALGRGFWSALSRETVQGLPSADQLHLARLRASRLGLVNAGAFKAIPILDLEPYPDGEAYLASRSSKMRATLRRAERQLGRLGDLGFTVHGPNDVEAVLAWLPRFLEVRRAKLRNWNPRGDAFLTNLVRCALPSGLVHASTLSLDGEPISWEINLYHAGTLHGYSCAYEARFRQYSPGSLHRLRLVGWLKENGGRVYDFMRGGKEHKVRWTDGETQQVASFARRSDSLGSRMRHRAQRSVLRLAHFGGNLRRASPPAKEGNRPSVGA